MTQVERVGAATKLGYRPELDGLRAVAITGVFLFHAEAGLPGGWVGVDLFFVLSGFLITRLLLDEHRATGRIDLPGFWGRRLRRLMPASVTVAVAFGAAVGVTGLAWVFGYVANWAKVAGTDLGPLDHFWSLAVEEQFYLLWPPLLLLLLRRGRIVGPLVGLIVAVTVWRAVLAVGGASTNRLHFGSDVRADALLVGCLVAVLHARRIFTPTLRAAALAGAVLAVVAVADIYPGSTAAVWVYSVAAFSSAVMVVGVVEHRPRWLRFGPLVRVGVLSYGLYLWHWPVLYALDGEPLAVRVGVGVAATFVLAVGSERLIESRFRSSGSNVSGELRLRESGPVHGGLVDLPGEVPRVANPSGVAAHGHR